MSGEDYSQNKEKRGDDGSGSEEGRNKPSSLLNCLSYCQFTKTQEVTVEPVKSPLNPNNEGTPRLEDAMQQLAPIVHSIPQLFESDLAIKLEKQVIKGSQNVAPDEEMGAEGNLEEDTDSPVPCLATAKQNEWSKSNLQGTLERECGVEGVKKDDDGLKGSKIVGPKKRKSYLTAVKIIPGEVKESIIVSGKKETSLGSKDEIENLDGQQNNQGTEKIRQSQGPQADPRYVYSHLDQRPKLLQPNRQSSLVGYKETSQKRQKMVTMTQGIQVAPGKRSGQSSSRIVTDSQKTTHRANVQSVKSGLKVSPERKLGLNDSIDSGTLSIDGKTQALLQRVTKKKTLESSLVEKIQDVGEKINECVGSMLRESIHSNVNLIQELPSDSESHMNAAQEGNKGSMDEFQKRMVSSMAYVDGVDEMGDYLGKVSQKFDINIPKYKGKQQRHFQSSQDYDHQSGKGQNQQNKKSIEEVTDHQSRNPNLFLKRLPNSFKESDQQVSTVDQPLTLTSIRLDPNYINGTNENMCDDSKSTQNNSEIRVQGQIQGGNNLTLSKISSQELSEDQIKTIKESNNSMKAIQAKIAFTQIIPSSITIPEIQVAQTIKIQKVQRNVENNKIKANKAKSILLLKYQQRQKDFMKQQMGHDKSVLLFANNHNSNSSYEDQFFHKKYETAKQYKSPYGQVTSHNRQSTIEYMSELLSTSLKPNLEVPSSLRPQPDYAHQPPRNWSKQRSNTSLAKVIGPGFGAGSSASQWNIQTLLEENQLFGGMAPGGPGDADEKKSVYERLQDEEFKKSKKMLRDGSYGDNYNDTQDKIKRLYRLQMLRQQNRSDHKFYSNYNDSLDKTQSKFYSLNDFSLLKPQVNIRASSQQLTEKQLFDGYNQKDRQAQILKKVKYFETKIERDVLHSRDKILDVVRILTEHYSWDEIEQLIRFEAFIRKEQIIKQMELVSKPPPHELDETLNKFQQSQATSMSSLPQENPLMLQPIKDSLEKFVDSEVNQQEPQQVAEGATGRSEKFLSSLLVENDTLRQRGEVLNGQDSIHSIDEGLKQEKETTHNDYCDKEGADNYSLARVPDQASIHNMSADASSKFKQSLQSNVVDNQSSSRVKLHPDAAGIAAAKSVCLINSTVHITPSVYNDPHATITAPQDQYESCMITEPLMEQPHKETNEKVAMDLESKRGEMMSRNDQSLGSQPKFQPIWEEIQKDEQTCQAAALASQDKQSNNKIKSPLSELIESQMCDLEKENEQIMIAGGQQPSSLETTHNENAINQVSIQPLLYYQAEQLDLRMKNVGPLLSKTLIQQLMATCKDTKNQQNPKQMIAKQIQQIREIDRKFPLKYQYMIVCNVAALALWKQRWNYKQRQGAIDSNLDGINESSSGITTSLKKDSKEITHVGFWKSTSNFQNTQVNKQAKINENCTNKVSKQIQLERKKYQKIVHQLSQKVSRPNQTIDLNSNSLEQIDRVQSGHDMDTIYSNVYHELGQSQIKFSVQKQKKKNREVQYISSSQKTKVIKHASGNTKNKSGLNDSIQDASDQVKSDNLNNLLVEICSSVQDQSKEIPPQSSTFPRHMMTQIHKVRGQNSEQSQKNIIMQKRMTTSQGSLRQQFVVVQNEKNNRGNQTSINGFGYALSTDKASSPADSKLMKNSIGKRNFDLMDSIDTGENGTRPLRGSQGQARASGGPRDSNIVSEEYQAAGDLNDDSEYKSDVQFQSFQRKYSQKSASQGYSNTTLPININSVQSQEKLQNYVWEQQKQQQRGEIRGRQMKLDQKPSFQKSLQKLDVIRKSKVNINQANNSRDTQNNQASLNQMHQANNQQNSNPYALDSLLFNSAAAVMANSADIAPSNRDSKIGSSGTREIGMEPQPKGMILENFQRKEPDKNSNTEVRFQEVSLESKRKEQVDSYMNVNEQKNNRISPLRIKETVSKDRYIEIVSSEDNKQVGNVPGESPTARNNNPSPHFNVSTLKNSPLLKVQKSEERYNNKLSKKQLSSPSSLASPPHNLPQKDQNQPQIDKNVYESGLRSDQAEQPPRYVIHRDVSFQKIDSDNEGASVFVAPSTGDAVKAEKSKGDVVRRNKLQGRGIERFMHELEQDYQDKQGQRWRKTRREKDEQILKYFSKDGLHEQGSQKQLLLANTSSDDKLMDLKLLPSVESKDILDKILINPTFDSSSLGKQEVNGNQQKHYVNKPAKNKAKKRQQSLDKLSKNYVHLAKNYSSNQCDSTLDQASNSNNAGITQIQGKKIDKREISQNSSSLRRTQLKKVRVPQTQLPNQANVGNLSEDLDNFDESDPQGFHQQQQLSSGRKNYPLKQGRLSPKFDFKTVNKNRTLSNFIARNIQNSGAIGNFGNQNDHQADWGKPSSIQHFQNHSQQLTIQHAQKKKAAADAINQLYKNQKLQEQFQARSNSTQANMIKQKKILPHLRKGTYQDQALNQIQAEKTDDTNKQTKVLPPIDQSKEFNKVSKIDLFGQSKQQSASQLLQNQQFPQDDILYDVSIRQMVPFQGNVGATNNQLGQEHLGSGDPTTGSATGLDYAARASSLAYGAGSESPRLESREAVTTSIEEKTGMNSDIGTVTLRGEPQLSSRIQTQEDIVVIGGSFSGKQSRQVPARVKHNQFMFQPMGYRDQINYVPRTQSQLHRKQSQSRNKKAADSLNNRSKNQNHITNTSMTSIAKSSMIPKTDVTQNSLNCVSVQTSQQNQFVSFGQQMMTITGFRQKNEVELNQDEKDLDQVRPHILEIDIRNQEAFGFQSGPSTNNKNKAHEQTKSIILLQQQTVDQQKNQDLKQQLKHQSPSKSYLSLPYSCEQFTSQYESNDSVGNNGSAQKPLQQTSIIHSQWQSNKRRVSKHRTITFNSNNHPSQTIMQRKGSYVGNGSFLNTKAEKSRGQQNTSEIKLNKVETIGKDNTAQIGQVVGKKVDVKRIII